MRRNSIIDLVFPRRCPLCGEVRAYGDKWVCDNCDNELVWIEKPVCLKCGKTISNAEAEYCGDCERIKKSFERCYPVFAYEGAVKDSLYQFKYKNQREYAVFYSDCIMKMYGHELRRLAVDGIVPVPVHSHKKKVRGYNQAELIARELGKRLDISVYGNYLERNTDTNPQKELDDKERMKNLKNAFNISENGVKLSKVLLVDDIYTSGATMEACTSTLLQGGVKEVYCVSVAIGRGFDR